MSLGLIRSPSRRMRSDSGTNRSNRPRTPERRDPVIEHRPLRRAGSNDPRVGDPERPLHGPAADGPGGRERVLVGELDEGVATAVGDVADGAVDVEVGPGPVVEVRLL